jgi:hypothetical protein
MSDIQQRTKRWPNLKKAILEIERSSLGVREDANIDLKRAGVTWILSEGSIDGSGRVGMREGVTVDDDDEVVDDMRVCTATTSMKQEHQTRLRAIERLSRPLVGRLQSFSVRQPCNRCNDVERCLEMSL